MSLEDFFKPMNLNDKLEDLDYTVLQPYIESVKIFSHFTYQSLYIVDYYKREFVYVSDNPIFLCGKSALDVKKMGWYFYYNYVPEEDLKLLLEINQAGFAFYNQLPVEERLKYIISYDFHLKQPNKHLQLINHKLAPLVLDKSSNIWLALCLVSTSSNKNAGNIIIQEIDSNKMFRYDIDRKLWELQTSIKLTKIQKEILLLSSQGLTMVEIAKSLFISLSTVKTHRTNILKKLKVKNIGEAIASASNYKLF